MGSPVGCILMSDLFPNLDESQYDPGCGKLAEIKRDECPCGGIFTWTQHVCYDSKQGTSIHDWLHICWKCGKIFDD